MPPRPMASQERILATPSLCERFIFYNVDGFIYVLTAKYKRPKEFSRGDGILCSALNSETNEHVAIRKLPYPFLERFLASWTLREIKALQHMNHENIVAIKDVVPPLRRKSMSDVYIVFEIMDTDLDQIIRSNQALSEMHYKYLLYQLLCALKYLGSANVVHRDLRPSNIFVNKNFDLKIWNFRHCGLTTEELSSFLTRSYCPPEVLLAATEYTKSIDMWSVGCIFMELVNRRPLFPSKDIMHQIRMIVEFLGNPTEAEMEILNDRATPYLRMLPKFPRQSLSARFPRVNPSAIDLVEKMLTFDPRRRITVDDALAHPYLQGVRNIRKESVCRTPLNFDYELQDLSPEQVKELFYQEVRAFNPEFQFEELIDIDPKNIFIDTDFEYASG